MTRKKKENKNGGKIQTSGFAKKKELIFFPLCHHLCKDLFLGSACWRRYTKIKVSAVSKISFKTRNYQQIC